MLSRNAPILTRGIGLAISFPFLLEHTVYETNVNEEFTFRKYMIYYCDIRTGYREQVRLSEVHLCYKYKFKQYCKIGW